MADFKETVIGYLNVDDFATFSSGERKWVSKMLKLYETHKDEMKLIAHPDNNDGIIVVHVPKKWLKVSPPRKVEYTEEQRAALAERLAAARDKNKESD